MQPIVDIGLASYHGHDHNYLARAIRSIQEQTFHDWRLIVASNDDEGGDRDVFHEQCAHDDRCEFLDLHGANVGASTLYSLLAAQALAPYYVAAVFDDWYGPDYLDAVLPALAQDDVALAHSRTWLVDSNGHTIGHPYASEPVVDSDKALTRLLQCWEQLDLCNLPHGVWRTSVLRQIFPLFRSWPAEHAFDVVALCRASLHGKIAVVDDAQYFRTRSSLDAHQITHQYAGLQAQDHDPPGVFLPYARMIRAVLNAVRTWPNASVKDIEDTCADVINIVKRRKLYWAGLAHDIEAVSGQVAQHYWRWDWRTMQGNACSTLVADLPGLSADLSLAVQIFPGNLRARDALRLVMSALGY